MRDKCKVRRQSIRLPGFDYTQCGAYFLTICSHKHRMLFGVVEDGEVRLSSIGKIASEEWFKTAEIRSDILLAEDEFVLMPNHLHGIIHLHRSEVGARRRRAPTAEGFGKPVQGSLPTVVRSYKSIVTRRVNLIRGTPGGKIWQRNYHERVIRDNRELAKFRLYIHQNPSRWYLDPYCR